MSKANEIAAMERRINAAKKAGKMKQAEDMMGVLLKLKRASNKSKLQSKNIG